uniref:Uncharacterized protein n=1 Tax=Arundo donax TaxID=35708 RepID=A0A0A9C086_ARUDO
MSNSVFVMYTRLASGI